MPAKASDGSMIGHSAVRTRLGLLPMPALGVKCGPGPQAWSAIYPFASPQSAFYPRPDDDDDNRKDIPSFFQRSLFRLTLHHRNFY